MSNQRQRGSVEGFIASIIVAAIFILPFFVGFRLNNEVTSGIAYNTSNDAFISGNTNFSVRASEATYTTTENQSTYCLPPDSPYKAIVNKAAADKRVKIEVHSNKYFTFKAPWQCASNVTVNEVK
jgi:hypothetical protein